MEDGGSILIGNYDVEAFRSGTIGSSLWVGWTEHGP
jgi:hypothetical protein